MTAGSSATRVLVSRPVAEALMPRDCPHVDCEGEGDTHCWGCHGSGSLPPVLRLLVVEAERELHIVRLPDCRLEVQPEPPVPIVRAIEAGERIGIETECEHTTCGDPRRSEGLEWVCDHWRTDGRVQVGSVRPVRVVPVRTCTDHIEHICVHPHWMPPAVLHHLPLLEPDESGRTEHALTEALAVYGPAESLVGKFAVEVEDARREP